MIRNKSRIDEAYTMNGIVEDDKKAALILAHLVGYLSAVEEWPNLEGPKPLIERIADKFEEICK